MESPWPGGRCTPCKRGEHGDCVGWDQFCGCDCGLPRTYDIEGGPMRLLTLADQLRRWGITVVEVDGWQTRGRDFPAPPKVVVWHHTGTPQSAKGNYPSLAVVRDGRADLHGPLCQVGIGRDGTAYVIASGVANHAGKGTWQGIDVGNSKSVGIEAESPGDGTWTPAQRAAYPRVAAALHDLLGTAAGLSCAHRESARPLGRKVDPAGIDMDQMRADVARMLAAGPPKPHAATAHAVTTPTPVQEDDMSVIVKGSGPAQYVTDFLTKRHIVDMAELNELKKAGLKTVVVSDALLASMPEVKA